MYAVRTGCVKVTAGQAAPGVCATRVQGGHLIYTHTALHLCVCICVCVCVYRLYVCVHAKRDCACLAMSSGYVLAQSIEILHTRSYAHVVAHQKRAPPCL